MCGAACRRGITPGAAFRESCNQLQYGATQPPAYDLSMLTAPTVYFLGGKDCEALLPAPQLHHCDACCTAAGVCVVSQPSLCSETVVVGHRMWHCCYHCQLLPSKSVPCAN